VRYCCTSQLQIVRTNCFPPGLSAPFTGVGDGVTEGVTPTSMLQLDLELYLVIVACCGAQEVQGGKNA